LYSSVVAPADTVAELAVWATLGRNSYLSATQTPSEYAAMRTMIQSFAAAARIKAYRDQTTEAEKQVKEVEKEREKLEKNIQNLQANTTSNLARIETLQKQNIENTLKARQDSVKLITNAQQLELRKLRLQRRRDRLTTLERK
jgi:pantothenate synthetase